MTVIIADDAFDKGKPCVLYDNILTRGTVTAVSAASGYDILNAISGTTWDFYRPSTAGVVDYAVDMGAATEVDCAFIDAHNIVGDVFVQRSSDGVNWSSVTDTVDVSDGAAIMFIWRGVSYRYWRFVFDCAVAPDIGVLMMGKRLVFPQGVDTDHTSIQHARRYELLGGDSLTGQFTGQKVIKRAADVDVTFPLLDAEWVDAELAGFEYHYNTGQPFAFAAMPSRYPADMGYCQRPENAGELRPKYYEGGMYEEFTMSLGVYVNG
jgi:hypothetical protein